MKNNISNEIRQNIKEASKVSTEEKINNEFDPNELLKIIIKFLKNSDDVSDIKKRYEEYSVISGDYIYFKETLKDGEELNWVLALGVDEE